MGVRSVPVRIIDFTLSGCATKKTSNQIGMAGGRARVFPSKRFQEWERAALKEIRFDIAQDATLVTVDFPVWVRAHFFRSSNIGDLLNYEQALADVLEKSRILKNDSLIRSWDGSRLDVYRGYPHVDVEIFEFGE